VIEFYRGRPTSFIEHKRTLIIRYDLWAGGNLVWEYTPTFTPADM